MIIWKPKVLLYGWWDAELYESQRQKLLAARTTPEPEPRPAPAAKRGRKSVWKTLEEGSPALALLRFLADYERQHGQMPTNQEIATQHFRNPKTGHASFGLSVLERGGWITRQFYVARGITITAQGRAVLQESLVA